jgi:hypothetical protein
MRLTAPTPLSILTGPNDYLTKQPMTNAWRSGVDGVWLMARAQPLAKGEYHGEADREAKGKEFEDAGEHLLVRSAGR